MIVGSDALYNEAKASLERVQGFDASSLARESDLGNLNFNGAIPPSQYLIDLYKRLSVTALQDFPDSVLTIIKDNANSQYKLFSQILEFDLTTQQNPSAERTTIITNIKDAYPQAFQTLHPYISYSLHRSADFQRFDSDARATLQAIEDKASDLSLILVQHESDAKRVLDEIRQVAAEEGITKRAEHFNAEFTHHSNEADKWQDYVVKLSIGLGVYSVLSLFLHKITFLKPVDLYDAIQLSISKFLIFFVIAYMLFLSAKNFLNHKHNAIVNKHRQNALMTHSALVEASGNEGVRDAVLLQASSCIFSPQSTGYSTSSESDVSNQKSMVEILSRPIAQAFKDSSQ